MKVKTNPLERKKPMRIIAWTVVVIFVALTLFVGRNSFLKVIINKVEVSKLEKKVNLLNAENDRLRKENHELKTNPEVIEKIAREKLGYQKSDEKVFRFIKSADDGTSETVKESNGADR
ncbi:MAG: septum formation initiator family protein [Candidatus Cloacimonadaceae bacterium]